MKDIPSPNTVPPIDLARQLAALHQLCVTYTKELQQLSVVQVGRHNTNLRQDKLTSS